MDITENQSEMAEEVQGGRLLTFFIGDVTYGIDMHHITEIVGLQAVTEVPDMPVFMKGIINLRGKIIPVMDIRLRFGIEERAYNDRTCFIVIDISGTPVGLIVDSVSEVMAVPPGEIAAVPPAGAGKSNRYVKSIGKTGSGVVLILDCERLFAEDELLRLANL
ncbi:purine-binding chemotaxis protein CheW [Sporobacter termitidis DSM 10068]|uniref:Chemotaxis protein CheW n=1 Tax=Sporobacter termitidis DSM 10068 TaxID=1123282 RepID=A0A1M5Z9M3_9FIRM|nr:purine-binding chemotaxis protein CheW [Sporobacter termitidis DSM 10068]